jgi:hypothetical protein
MRFVKSVSLVVAAFVLSMVLGCSHEVGSKEWCADMKEKPKKDWTASEATDYAKHCVFK